MLQLTVDAPKLRHQPPASRFWESVTVLHRRRTSVIAVFAAAAILVHLVLRFALRAPLGIYQIPLLAALVFGGIPLLYELARNLYGENSAAISSPEFPSLLLFFSMNTSPVQSLS